MDSSGRPADAAGTFPLGPFVVNRIGFGAMQLPGPGVLGPPKDRAEAIAVLRRAVELGVNHLDTAQYYGPDVANELIRSALHPYPPDLALVTKLGAQRDAAGGWPPAQRPAELRSALEDNLRALGVDHLAAANLRLLGEHTPAGVHYEDQLAEMVALRDEGKIVGIGVSTASLGQVDTALQLAGIVCVQNAYNLVDRSDAAVLARCTDAGIAYVPYFPLGSAFPGQPKVAAQPAVQQVARRLGCTPAQVGLAWLLAQAPNVLLIPGTSSLRHLEQNVAAAAVALSAEDLAELESALASPTAEADPPA